MRGGWRLTTLGEICDIARGGSPRPIQKFLTDRRDGINWVKIGDATASSKYIYKTEEKIIPAGVKHSRLVKPGDFLLSNSMSFGRPYIMQATGCIHDGWLVLRDKSNLFNQDYLYYFLGSAAAYKQFDNLAAGSTVRNLNTELVKRVTVPLPSLSEQKSIVVILDEVFAGLETATTSAEKNLKNARELFENALHSAFHSAGDLVALSTFASDITDGDHMPPPKAASGVPFITISNIDKGTHEINFADTFKVPESYFGTLKDNKKPRRGDVLYTVTGSFGIPVIVDSDERFCFQRHIGLIRPKADVSSKWLYYALCSKFAFGQAASGATGTAQKTVSLKLLRNIQLPNMSAEAQDALTARLDNVRQISRQLEAIYRRKIDSVAELKQSILQKAFSGELTCPPSEATREAAE